MTASDTAPTAALGRTLKTTLAALALVWTAARRQQRISVVLQVVGAALTAGQLLLVKAVVTHLVDTSGGSGVDAGEIAPSFAALVVAFTASGVVAALLEQQQRMMTDLVGHHTMRGLIDVSARVGFARFEDPSFHDHLERARDAAMFRPIEMVNGLTTVLTSVVTSVVVMIALLTLEPLLVPLVALAAVPVLLASLYNSRQSYAFEYGMTTHAREHLHLLELLTGVEAAKELRVFSATGFLLKRYDALTRERLERLREFLRGRLRVALLGTTATGLGIAIALGSLIWLLDTGRTSVPTAAAAAAAMLVLAVRLQQVTTGIGKVTEGGLFLADYNRFLAITDDTEAPDADRVPRAAASTTFEGLEVRDVSFTYPQTGRRVLHDVSLELRPGEVVALVGENGSGKTTLVKLLCRLYSDVDAGSVRLNGHDIGELHPRDVRERITVLFQDFVRYDLSARDNILMGRSDAPASDERLREATDRAGAQQLIEQLASGYETRLGRRFHGGSELSGGQWQRLALARAFYRGGDVLILDEPTAALDPRAEADFFRQVGELAKDKSVILVSHRFSSVRSADRIYVLEDGRMIETGSHDDLVGLEGVYSELYELQARQYLGAERK